jgi:hypothetical protein
MMFVQRAERHLVGIIQRFPVKWGLSAAKVCHQVKVGLAAGANAQSRCAGPTKAPFVSPYWQSLGGLDEGTLSGHFPNAGPREE